MRNSIIRLLLQSQVDIHKLQDYDDSLYVPAIDKVVAIFSSIRLNASWAETIDLLDETTVTTIRAAGDIISHDTTTPTLITSDLGVLEDETQKIISHVQTSNIPAQLKDLLLAHLNDMLQAIYKYDLFGRDGIQEEIERTYGSLITHSASIRDSGANGQVYPVWEYLGRICTIIKLTEFALAIANGITAYLNAPTP